jgi:hypothetical protein
MKTGIAAVVGVLGLVLLPAGPASAQEMECTEFESGEAVCDDGAQMIYRANPTSSFVRLDQATRLQVLAYLISNAGGGGAAQADEGSDDGHTSHFGSSGSVTSYGGCVSMSAPGVSFMGSGC